MSKEKSGVEVREVKTKRELKDFVYITDKIFKGSPYYVPSFKSDDMKMLDRARNPALESCEILPLVAYRGGRPVARVLGVIQSLWIQKTGKKQARFHYFDAFDDFEAVGLMFARLEAWARGRGMDAVHGPLGFNDTDREGMLIEGFDTLGTFVSLYNHPYYPELMAKLGYVKDADWVQYRLKLPDQGDRITKLFEDMSERALKRQNLRFARCGSGREYVDRYGMEILRLVNIAYADLYGTVEFSDAVARNMIKMFKILMTRDMFSLLLNEQDRLVAFAFCFPSISRALNKSRGRLFPLGLLRILWARKHYKVVDFGLVGVLPEYRDKGLPAALMIDFGRRFMSMKRIERMETNLMLEDNTDVHSLFRHFEKEQYRRNRAYIKELKTEN